MDLTHHRDKLAGVGLVALGAGALGWISRLPGGQLAAVKSSLATPAIVIGVCIVLAPALYIGLSLAGARTTTSSFVRGIERSWRASGLVALGLAPPLLFMVATSSSEKLALAFGVLAIFCSLLVGLMALAKEAAEHSPASLFCFVLWAFSALAVGARLFFRAVIA